VDPTWQEALAFLHARGWRGELVEEACEALVREQLEGPLRGRDLAGLSPGEVRAVLREPVAEDEARALLLVADAWDRADAVGDRLRAALGDLDAFADGLGPRD
jgi:hypothetical protein